MPINQNTFWTTAEYTALAWFAALFCVQFAFEDDQPLPPWMLFACSAMTVVVIILGIRRLISRDGN